MVSRRTASQHRPEVNGRMHKKSNTTFPRFPRFQQAEGGKDNNGHPDYCVMPGRQDDPQDPDPGTDPGMSITSPANFVPHHHEIYETLLLKPSVWDRKTPWFDLVLNISGGLYKITDYNVSRFGIHPSRAVRVRFRVLVGAHKSGRRRFAAPSPGW